MLCKAAKTWSVGAEGVRRNKRISANVYMAGSKIEALTCVDIDARRGRFRATIVARPVASSTGVVVAVIDGSVSLASADDVRTYIDRIADILCKAIDAAPTPFAAINMIITSMQAEWLPAKRVIVKNGDDILVYNRASGYMRIAGCKVPFAIVLEALTEGTVDVSRFCDHMEPVSADMVTTLCSAG